MKKYKCQKCGYILNIDLLDKDFVCPTCSENIDSFILMEDSLIDEEIDAIVETMVEESKEQTNKIINDKEEDKKVRISNYNYAIMRIDEKCINCGQCKRTCETKENIRYDLNKCKEPICVGCGQCILNCPTGALVPKYSYRDVKEIIDANNKVVVALTSPAVRVSMGDEFKLEYGTNVELKLVSALKKLGFDYVFDTAVGADITILEEVSEFVNRITEKLPLPQFTSCCPSWVKYAEVYHPELLDNLSTCKSPIGMECALIKSYFAEKKDIDKSKIVTVAITPCTSKKMEAREYVGDIDYVLTASEVSLLLKENDINLSALNDTEYDNLFGESTGAGILFGATGGVTESAMRTMYKLMTGNKPTEDFINLESLRGLDDIKTATINIDNKKIRVAVVNGISNLEKILENDEYKKYHFIEVMNCKGGCSGGGGQPLTNIPKLDEVREKRINTLYEIDKKKKKKSSFENNDVKRIYKEYLKKPLSEESKRILHTSFSDKSNLLKEDK